MNFRQRNIERCRASLRRQCRRSSSSLTHSHARCLDPQPGVRQSITADTSTSDDNIATALWDERAQRDRWYFAWLQWLWPHSRLCVQVNWIERVADGVVEDSPRRVIVNRDQCFAFNAIGLSKTRFWLQMHEPFLFLANAGENRISPGQIRLGRRT